MKAIGILLAWLAVSQAAYDYSEVLRNSLLFYQVQRSGRLTGMDPKLFWRKDSALGDKGDNGEDLTGGYYDAGDFVKFGYPMAYSITTLAWGLIDYRAGYDAAGSTAEAMAAIRWGTDYFLKAHISSNEFYGQVGDATADHNYWGRPEDMTMARPAYKINTGAPGSDLAAETAAALAAASMVFRDTDSGYAETLLSHARQLYDFADNYRGIYSTSMPAASPFYSSYSFEDELTWGAAWLARATGDTSYLNKAENYYTEFGLQYWGGGFSWDSKVSGVEALLARLSTNNQLYKDQLTTYCENMVHTQQRTPSGIIFYSDWGSLRSLSNALLICLQAADLGINTQSYRDTATQQVGLILGDTGRSFVTGIGNNPPLHAHHRSSSCPLAPEPCDWNTFNGDQPNAQTLYGALVGGPGSNDEYTDTRQDAVHNEVAMDYNAAFQGVIAGLAQIGKK